MRINLGFAEIVITFNTTKTKVMNVLKEKGKISAVKFYRDELKKRKISLRQAKEYVDNIAMEIDFN